MKSSNSEPRLTRWERIGRTTLWGRYLAEVEERVILRGLEYAGPPSYGIDLGSGGGRWSSLLSERGWGMTCIDVDSEDLAVCQRNVPNAKCILTGQEDRAIPGASESANIALCIEVAPLIESDWFALEVFRVLAEGGIFIGVYINGQSLRGVASRVKDRLLKRGTDYDFYQYSYADWRQRLLQTGFEMLHEESFSWGPFGRESNSPFVPAWTKIERSLRLYRIVTWGPWVAFIARKKGCSEHDTRSGHIDITRRS